MRGRRAGLLVGLLLALVGAVVLAALAGGGSDGREDGAGRTQAPTAPPRSGSIEELVVGRGARAAIVLRAGAARPSAPVVVFLHGWSAVDANLYREWLRHLVRGGATVVFPIYQQVPFIDARTPLRNVRVSVRAALERIGSHGPVLAAGHSAGGALAADLAASARAARLPVPVAVYAIYPGRSLPGFSARLTGPPPSRIPARTRILALASPFDRVVGTATAREIVSGATRVPRERRTLRLIRDRAVGDHLAPQRDGARERRTFWAPLDRLLRAAAQASGSRPSQVPAEP